MLKKLIIAGIAAATLFACKKGFEKTDTGLEYKILEDKEGEPAKKGQVMTIHFAIKTPKDSVLRSTWKEGTPIPIEVFGSSFKGGLEEGLLLLSAGDSALFGVNADSLYAKTYKEEVPAFIGKGGRIFFTIKVLKVQDKADFEKEQSAKMEERKKEVAEQTIKQREIDEKLIQEYLQKNNLKAARTESGLYYYVTKPGKGPNAHTESTVTVNYKGRVLNGLAFDSSYGKQPLQFRLGKGEVIPGWDEGLALLNPGAKGVLIVPSHLGYGPMNLGEIIPPFSVLVFDVELLKAE